MLIDETVFLSVSNTQELNVWENINTTLHCSSNKYERFLVWKVSFQSEKNEAEGKQFGFGFGGFGLPSFLPVKPGYYNLGQIHNKIPNSEEITKVTEACWLPR